MKYSTGFADKLCLGIHSPLNPRKIADGINMPALLPGPDGNWNWRRYEVKLHELRKPCRWLCRRCAFFIAVSLAKEAHLIFLVTRHTR